MNVTLQTNNFNPQYGYKNLKQNNKNNNNLLYAPSFTAGIGDVPQKSKLLNPVSRAMDKFTTWLSKNYTDKLYTSWLAKKLASKAEKLDSVVDVMAILGSVVISGMYMIQTLRNKDLDEDRRKTLAINQGLTFLMATLGSVTIDKSLDKWWEKQTEKYAVSRTGDAKLPERIKAINDKAIKKAEEELGKPLSEFTKKEKKKHLKLTNTLKYVEDNLENTDLEVKLKGMGVLKKLIIFGTVYRFLSPVAVTPLANMIGNKLVAKKEDSGKTAAQTK